jgi:hypothetical protein
VRRRSARAGVLLGLVAATAIGGAIGGGSARGEDPATPPPGPVPAPTPEGEPEAAAAPLDEQIKTAIEKGVAFLRTQQRASGWWGDLGSHVPSYAGTEIVYQYPLGPTALALYTLLKCDVPVTDPAVKKGFDWLKKAGIEPHTTAYEVSTALLAVTAVADPFKKGKDSRAAGEKVRLTGEWRAWATALHAALLQRRSPRGWRYEANSKVLGGPEDVSSTQFAVLALAAADRCGIATDPAVYGDAAAYVLTLQETEGPPVERVVRVRAKPGPAAPAGGPGRYAPAKPEEAPPKDRARGFRYSVHATTREHERTVTGIRTACGVGTLALARYALAAAPPKKAPAADPKALEQALYDGLAWLSQNWDPWETPGFYAKNCFYLYCVERAMDLVGAERLGDRFWYREMVEALLPRQDEKGFWDTKDRQIGDRGPVCDTCFALLFLRRAAKGGVPIPIVTGDE